MPAPPPESPEGRLSLRCLTVAIIVHVAQERSQFLVHRLGVAVHGPEVGEGGRTTLVAADDPVGEPEDTVQLPSWLLWVQQGVPEVVHPGVRPVKAVERLSGWGCV